MKLQRLIFLLLLVFFYFSYSSAQDTSLVTLAKRVPEKQASELRFIGYAFTRSTVSNIAPTNELLRGQIIGRLFGPNTTNTSDRTSTYFEQRFVPMFIYSPSILDGVATFRGLFKIDMTWGDAAYGVGNNLGGGINGGFVNMQTLLANVDIRPKDADWNIVIGLQRIFDNVRDPNVTAISTALSSGFKLCYWGTQAVGINVYGKLNPTTLARAGYFQFYENLISENDDVTMWMFDIESRISPRFEAGLDLWYAYDRGKSAGGISILGQGLNSTLAEYNGATRLNINKYQANVFWAGTHASYNRDFFTGRWWFSGFFMANFGNIDSIGTENKRAASIFGFALNGAINYKYGMTPNDRLCLQAIYSSGDANNISDGKVESVITGNVYGSPTAIYGDHKAMLLFPDTKVVNRYYSVVHDISNMGLGVTGIFLSGMNDLIPNKLNIKVGTAVAFSNVTPKSGGSYIGTELNTELLYTYRVFLTLGLHASYLKIGDFFDGPTTTYNGLKPKDPWVIFSSLSWTMF